VALNEESIDRNVFGAVTAPLYGFGCRLSG